MNIAKFEDWIHSRSDRLFDAIRIYLGLGLVGKGVSYLIHLEPLPSLAGVPWAASLTALVPYIHIVGGLMMAFGIYTRMAALVQIPILIGAVFIVNLGWMDTVQMREGFEFSCLVLFLLVLITLKGSGPLSLLYRRRRASEGPANPYQRWVESHSDVFLDLIRAYLGVGLFLKGLFLMEHQEYYANLFEQSTGWALLTLIGIHYVIPAHFAGGVALFAGLTTRLAAAVQLPALIGAIIISLSGMVGAGNRESFQFTALVFVLLSVLAVHGSGRLSL